MVPSQQGLGGAVLVALPQDRRISTMEYDVRQTKPSLHAGLLGQSHVQSLPFSVYHRLESPPEWFLSLTVGLAFCLWLVWLAVARHGQKAMLTSARVEQDTQLLPNEHVVHGFGALCRRKSALFAVNCP
jgi:hypothetical protein